MKSTFRAMTLAAVLAAVLVAVVVASMANAAPRAKVTISVAALRPGSSDDAQKQFNDNVALFEKQHPNIDVKAVEYAWNGATFAAQLAAGRLPTVFTVPFTDARTLGEHRQVADITAAVKRWPHYKKFQKTIIAEATTAKGRIIGVPYAAYAQALHYNRDLFKQAGLNPNKPPTTWAQLRTYAKRIAQRTGAAGYAQMGLNDNTAGWIATTVTYTLGGRMERGRGAAATATLNNKYTVQALNLLHPDALGRQLDGLDLRLHLADDQPGVRSRENRHVRQRLGHLHLPRPGREPRSQDLRHRSAPAGQEQDRRRPRRRLIAVLRPDTKGAKLDAAMKWIDFFYMEKLVKKPAAIRDARILVANKQPVGVPAFPIFNKAQFLLANSWVRPYINVPTKQMAPFLRGIFKQNLYPEPAASTQSVYHALDPVVQAVFADKNANVSDLLARANDVAQKAIRDGK